MTLLAPVLLLLPLAFTGCFSEVVYNFTQSCPQFFAAPGGVRSPPTPFTGPQYKQICQIKEKTYEYATLYDTANRIPVYSAYKFEGFKQCRRILSWFVEPQLDNPYGNKKGMEREGFFVQLQKQANNKDYEMTGFRGYDKVHLAPVYQASLRSCSDATFTLTNAAPQNSDFNRASWRATESRVVETLVKECKNNERYIVTGVVPGSETLKKRVRIPSHFWTAYCCLNKGNVTASGAFIGRNVQRSTVEKMSVAELDRQLTAKYGKGKFAVFGGKCNEPQSTKSTKSNTMDLFERNHAIHFELWNKVNDAMDRPFLKEGMLK